MTTIRCIYEEEPNFPGTDQHPDAVRYHVGKLVIDAIGSEPSKAEIDAVLNPPVRPDQETVKTLKIALITKGLLTQVDIDTTKTLEVF